MPTKKKVGLLIIIFFSFIALFSVLYPVISKFKSLKVHNLNQISSLFKINNPVDIAVTETLPEPNQKANKFGIGGSCAIGRDLGVGWMYLWGGGRNFPNETEINCNKTTGIKFFFTIGKTDTVVTYPDLTNWESQYILLDERDAYAQYKQLVENMAKPEARDSALGSYVLIPKYIQELGYRGAYYAIANEPDLERSVSTTEYAQQYKLVHDRIKKYDSTAKVGNGGFLSIIPEIGGKLISSDGLDPNNNRFVWIEDWRSKYKALYGTDVPIDFWNIHPYVFPINFSVSETLDRVDQFKAYLDRTGEGSKPIWITEYSVLGSEGDLIASKITCKNQKVDRVTQYCLSLEDRKREHAMIAQYMDGVTKGFMARPYLERWFWFYAGETWGSSARKLNYPGDIYKYTGETEYNAVGQKYRELIKSTSCPGNVAGDTCNIDLLDLLAVLPYVVEEKQYNAAFDPNKDGKINLSDLLFILNLI